MNALSILEKKLYQEENSQLLSLLEKATLHHLMGDYKKSLELFDKAKNLSDKLFTVSIKGKIEKTLKNDNFDKYYGMRFERSLIRYYQALNHILIAQSEENSQERSFHYQAARSVLIEWNVLLDSYQRQYAGEVTFKNDLMSFLFGSMVHQLIGTSSDIRISKDLLKKAQEVLFKNYGLYPSFNKKYEKFRSDFEKLPKLSLEEVRNNYVEQTSKAKDLKGYLNDKKKAVKDNIKFIIEEGFIAKKTAKKVNFPIPMTFFPLALRDSKNFIHFSSRVLTLSGFSRPTVSYELPQITTTQSPKELEVVIEKDGKEITKCSLKLVNPMNEIARLELENDLPAIKARLSARVLGKHAAALVSAYAAYNSGGGRGGDLFAYSIAATSYALANKAIRNSEKADLRHWASLPMSFQVGQTSLDKGQYQVFLVNSDQKVKITDLEVSDKNTPRLVKYRYPAP